MRILFFNEGNVGAHIMGQGQLGTALRVGTIESPGTATRFAELGPMGQRTTRLVYRTLRPMTTLGLDLVRLRWHLAQSARARHAVHRELSAWPADVVHLHTQSVAFLLGRTMRSQAFALSVDATVRDWANMPAWTPSGRYAAMPIAACAAFERRAFTRARVVLAWTAWAADAVARTAPQAHVIEHHPGLDLVRYRPAERRERRLPRLLFVGGRFKEKGGEDLLAALGPKLGVEVELDIVTPAAVAPREGVRVHRLEPSDPRLLELQQQADLFCLPTYGDAAPWAVLEAMACGTPVLSTEVGGIPDLVDHGRAGALVPHGDARALGEALHALLHDPDQRARLAASGRARCEERYDARHQFPRLVAHLDVLAGQPATARSA